MPPRQPRLAPLILVSALLLAAGSAGGTQGQFVERRAAPEMGRVGGGDGHENSSSANEKQQQYTAQLRSKTETGTEYGYGLAGYLLAERTDEQLDESNSLDATLSSILNRNGPDMRPMRDFRDFDDITPEVARRAWRLMRHHAQVAATDKLRFLKPIVERALEAANVSAECFKAAKSTVTAAQRLESWAIQLLTAWGNFPPTGVYEGTFGDIGSFHGCINVPQNSIIGHAHYCTIAYRPVLPKRPDYELIVRREPDSLLRMFDRSDGNGSNAAKDAFADLIENAQYNHYIYYKFGTCFPIGCGPHDVQRIAKLLGRRSILMSGPVKCHSKFEDDYEPSSSGLEISTRDLNGGIYIWKPHMTRTQKVATLVLSLLSGLILLLTLLDVAWNRLPRLTQLRFGLKANEEIAEGMRRSGKFKLNTTCSDKEVRKRLSIENLTGDGAGENFVCQDTNNNALPNLGQSHANATDVVVIHHSRSARSLSAQQHKCHNVSDVSLEKATTIPRDHQHGDYNNKVQQWAPFETEITASAGAAKENGKEEDEEEKLKRAATQTKKRSLFMEIADDCSIVTNTQQFFKVSQSQLKNDILCINGLRCITMSWIIVTHTMQYNDWSAFARTREIETHLKSLVNQPLFNASYLVDTFFLMSGLLTSLSSFRLPASCISSQASSSHRDLLWAKFSSRAYLIGRYLRLTPQILFVSLLFILLPQLKQSGGPHWYTITGEYSENCSQNWWINLLHIQAFYKSNEMCNFVCWWVSVDMFYHLFALALILLILRFGHRLGLLASGLLVLVPALFHALKHYQLELPPNLLSTIPQTGAMWAQMTLQFFWTPQAHAFPFFLGFQVGYLMARYKQTLAAWFTLKRALVGWSLAVSLLLSESYSTYFWVIGQWHYSPLISTLFHLITPIVWSICLAWIILACQFGFGGWINRALSCRLFIILGKASYIVYLSHFLILFTFFGSQNLLLEPTQMVMLYVILGNICLSMLLGCFLCVVFEMPWLKMQKRLMKYVR